MKQDTLTTRDKAVLWWDELPEAGKISVISTHIKGTIHEARKMWNECQGEITNEKVEEIYLSCHPETNKQKAELWWNTTVPESEIVQWKLSMVNKYYGNRPLARITPEMKEQMYLSEKTNNATELKTMNWWNDLHNDIKFDLAEKHQLNIDSDYPESYKPDQITKLYLSEHPQEPSLPLLSSEVYLLDEDWFLNNIDGDNAIVSDKHGFILETPNKETGIELCKRWNTYGLLANRVKELEREVKTFKDAHNIECTISGLLKDENEHIKDENAQLKKQVDVLREALQEIANWELPETGKFWDKEKTRPTSYETEYGSNGARDYIKNKAKSVLQSNTIK